MRINHTYRAHTGNYTPGGNSHRWIVVHNTANTASAEAEARYAENSRHDSSYHYVLDGGGTVYQLLDDADTAWAVGAWRGCTAYVRNSESISIEVCSAGTQFTTDEVAELRELVRHLMRTYGIDAAHVVRHWDCHSGRKACPMWYTPAGGDSDGARWAALHDTITREELATMRPADVWEYSYNGSNNCFNALHWGYANTAKLLEEVEALRNEVQLMKSLLESMPHDVWAYKNPKMESVDMHQMMVDVHDSSELIRTDQD